MFKFFKLRFAGWIFCAGWSSLASAAGPNPPVPPADGGRGAVLQNELEKQVPPTTVLPTPGPKEKPGPIEHKRTGEETLTVRSFRVEGATAISEADIQEVLKPWVGQTLTLRDLQDAADALSRLYSDRGLLAEVDIPPQKIGADEGEILLRVVEVRLGGVKVNSSEGQSLPLSAERISKYITAANPLGSLVNSGALERGAYLLKEVPGVSVSTELEPGASDGEVVLKVLAASTPLVSGMLSLGNSGSASTGKTQDIGTLNLNNPLGLGDAFHFTAVHTEGSTLGQFGFSLPVSPTGWVWGLSASAMRYSTVGDFAGSEGVSHTYGTTLTYPLVRSQEGNLNFSAAYDMKFYRNTTASTGQIVSDYHINALTLTVSGNVFDTFLGGGVNSGSLALVHGHWTSNNWDPQITTNYGQYNPFNYGKLSFTASRLQQIVPEKWTFNLSLNGQVAFDNLDGGEKFYLGGASGIRAYPASQGGGDSGAVLTMELQHVFAEGIQGLVFFDGGYVRQYKDAATYDTLVTANTTNANNGYFLAGAGVGAKYSSGAWNFSGSIAWPVGTNPLYGYSATALKYVQQNSDHTSGHPYAWLQASFSF